MKQKRTERQKGARRQKQTEIARNKKRQQVIDEYHKKGRHMTEEIVNDEVEAFMAKREVRFPEFCDCVC